MLFLKLLEGQLVNFHKDGKDYAFLKIDRVNDFDKLFRLFHKVLAVPHENRIASIKNDYKDVPYLNSSLFEYSELEDATIKINSLDDNAESLELLNNTVLKSIKKQKGRLPTLEYLFLFLDAYDFSTESKEDLQKEDKALITASVLGKVFEKINGYKDGSIYTPSFITMYMCEQSMRLAVVQKFNEVNNWTCKNFDELEEEIKEKIAEQKSKSEQKEQRIKYSEIVNSLKICDPAVGSGHFLVSALNQLIVIKSDLRLLNYRNGDRVSEYTIELANDELVITDIETGNYTYSLSKLNKPYPDKQKLQEALFHEKQTLIENCLFGVDINQKSVLICRLRLWIELLKNTYYKEDSGYTELETLPNIDINIKCGNSLVSRFRLDEDLSKVLKNINHSIKEYRDYVNEYKNEKSRDAKKKLQKIFSAIKSDIRTEINKNDPKRYKLKKAKGELFTLQNQMPLFDEDEKQKKAKYKRQKELDAEVNKLSEEIGEIENNIVYKNAFEWRFEFPEVLNDNGNFEGFDLMIGNPPYGVRMDNNTRQVLSLFDPLVPDHEIYIYFISKGISLLKSKGYLSFIQPNTFLAILYGEKYRQELIDSYKIVEIVDLSTQKTFDEANVRTCILTVGNYKVGNSDLLFFKKSAERNIIDYKAISKDVLQQNIANWLSLFNNSDEDLSLISKIRNGKNKVRDYFDVIRGYIAYRRSDLIKKYGEIEGNKIIDDKLWHSDKKNDDSFVQELLGKDISKYHHKERNLYVKYGKHLASYVDEKFYKNPHIVIREIAEDSLICAYVENGIYSSSSTHLVIAKNSEVSLKYLLAILNSKLIGWYNYNTSPKAKKGLFPKVLVNDINNYPVVKCGTDEQQAFVDIVDKIIVQKQQGNDTKELEMKIDKMIYALYGITDEKEIALIEQS